jgi:hypothetical protein
MSENNNPTPTNPEQNKIDKLMARVQEFANKKNIIAEANAIPLPGPAGGAFINGPIKVGDYTVRKIVKMDWRVWQQTDNAIIKFMAETFKPEAERQQIAEDPDSACVSIWMLTHTPLEIDRALQALGVDGFKALCKLETDQNMEGYIFNRLEVAVWEQVTRSGLTALKYAQSDSEDEQSDPFVALNRLISLQETKPKPQQPQPEQQPDPASLQPENLQKESPAEPTKKPDNSTRPSPSPSSSSNSATSTASDGSSTTNVVS